MSAVERIELSRARLRQAMQTPPASQTSAPTSGPLAWLERIKKQPTIAILIDALTNWWSHHPLRAVVHVASEASNAVARPIAQNNPLALVLAAGLFGALFAWSRPWRWALKPALFAGLMPRLVSRVVAQLPLESWLALFGSALSGSRAPTEPQRKSP